jgi:two-component system, chemotaxis family, CheB/CheR fusion protein
MATEVESTTTEGAGPAGGEARVRVVAVGASAGGLAATTQLVRHLGPQPGVAIVVVHHLDPNYPSSLGELIAKVTPLSVHTAADGLRVEANQIYVGPQNAIVGLKDGALTLEARTETAGHHHPIDRLFESLALDRSVQALGVVLTGTGSDGTVGIQAIKANGGITFAQDGSAEHRGMPESAIATGSVDFILAPDGIARELIRIGQREPELSRPDADEQAFRRILTALRAASAIDFANYKQTTFRRRVERRVIITGAASLSAYAELVEHNPEEARALCDEVLIHVTSFFRDPETFEALATTVFPKLLENRPRDTALRIWVPGCSTGEEVYSIAIALLEFLADANAGELPVKLFGTDVSASAIDKARSARYAAGIERDVSAGRLQRFFTHHDDLYQIRKDVRDLCVFAKQDATRDPPFAGMDLISCRNLMIYLGTKLQDRLLPIFHYALREPGFLVLGNAETIRSFPGFTPVDAKNRIYARTSAAPRTLLDLGDRRLPEVGADEGLAGAKASVPQDVNREVDRLVLAEFAPPGVVVTDNLAIVQFRGRTGPFLEPAAGVASFDLLRMVREELRLPLRQTIAEVRTKQAVARRTVSLAGLGSRDLVLEVIPFRVPSTPQRFFVVLFREVSSAAAEPPVASPAAAEAPDTVNGELAQELASTRDYLQSVIEQLEASNEELRAANEEIVSSNEELRSTNEELQMAKEELQATNEELRTMNDEMKVRNREATRLNEDLSNVLTSVAIPIVILGRDSRIRRFTPAAAKLFALNPSDVGRAFTDLKPTFPGPGLAPAIAQVLQKLTPVEKTVQDEGGRWFQVTVLPYVTLDNRIDGTVVTAVDVDAVKKGELLLAEARRYAESVVDAIRESLVVLDRDGRIRSANRAFLQMAGGTSGEIEGRLLYDVGGGEWNVPALRKRVEEMGTGDVFEGYRLEQDLKDGRRIRLLNGRRIEGTPLTLLVIEDVTERERAAEVVRQTELGFREMLTTAAEAILMADSSGKIVFANRRAEEIFGFAESEMLGLERAALIPERPSRGDGANGDGARRDGAGRHDGARGDAAGRHNGAGGDGAGRHDGAAAAQPPVAGSGLRGRRKNGTEFPVEVVIGSMPRPAGPLAVSFVTDITRRMEFEKKLRDYQDKLRQTAHDAALAEERERRRIAVEVHDHIGQALALAQIKLTSIREAIQGPPRVSFDQAVDLLVQSIADTRTLIFELSPPVLYDLGLKEALSWLVEDLEKRHGLPIDLSDDGADKPLPDATAALVFRAVRELLVNVSKHAHAASARVALRRADGYYSVDVEDRGVGFDPSEIDHAQPGSGFGLFSVREQIGRLGGTIEIASSPGQGTRVNLRVPIGGRPLTLSDGRPK